MAVSDFQNFEFLIPNFQQTNFLENHEKKQVFRIKKTGYMLWKPVFAMPMPNFEAIRQFSVTKLPPKRENYWYLSHIARSVATL